MTDLKLSRRDLLKIALGGGTTLLLLPKGASAQNTFQAAHIPAAPQP